MVLFRLFTRNNEQCHSDLIITLSLSDDRSALSGLLMTKGKSVHIRGLLKQCFGLGLKTGSDETFPILLGEDSLINDHCQRTLEMKS